MKSFQKLSLIFFENADTIPREFWINLCKAIKEFPQGLITFEYKAGALATGVNIAYLLWYCDTSDIFVKFILNQNFFIDCR